MQNLVHCKELRCTDIHVDFAILGTNHNSLDMLLSVQATISALGSYIVMAGIVMANIVMACIVMANIVMACVVMTYIVMAYTVMACIAMAYIAMAYI